MENRITGRTGMMGLIGTPVGHSGSPAMYNYSFEKLGLDYAYLAFDVNLSEVPEAISAIKTLKMKGCNVTMPCKSEVVKYMDELSAAARIIGAVNTIVNDNGKLIGHITDGEGFVRNVKENGEEIKGKKLTIMGAGGAATAIQVQCALEGAKEISIFNIKDSFFTRAMGTVEKLRQEVPGCVVNLYDLEDEAKLAEEIAASHILVNATMVGMKPNEDKMPIPDVSVLRRDLVVVDVIYNPRETKFIQAAKAAGCKKAIGGTGMLVWQGAAAFNLYTGLEMPAKEVQEKFFS